MKTTEIQCCDLMIYATQHAIIRTEPPRFGPDVLDQPLNNINYCPWCGAVLTYKAARKAARLLNSEGWPEGGKDVSGCDV